MKRMGTAGLIAAVVLLASAMASGSGDKPVPGQTGPGASEQQEELIYGNTPEDLKPYAKYVKEPYKKYWVPSDNPVMFWGPGRDKPEPEVETVKIGVIAPIERSYESYIGRSVLNGMRIALEDANAAGGYKGKPFEAVVKNDTGLWGATANEVVALTYEDKCWAIVGTVDGANTHIAIRVALRTDIAMMNVADLDPTLVETRIPWVVRVIPDDRQMAYTIAYYVFKQLGLNSVAILRASNRYGRFGVAQFRKSSIKLGKPAPIEINYEPNWDKVNPDFALQIARLQQVKPEALVLWADAQPAGVLVKRIRESGLTFPILACERIVNDEFLQAAGPAGEGVIATYPHNPTSQDPRYTDFVKRYVQKFGTSPDSYAVHSYDGTQMTVEAIRRAGLNRYRIRDEMAAMRRWDGISGLIDLDEALSNRRPVFVATVKGGRFVFGIPKMARLF